MWENFKSFLSDDLVFFSVVVLLVGIAAYGLGRYPIEPQMATQQGGVVLSTVPYEKKEVIGEKGQYVGSKNSDKYHLVTCSGAERIAEENKVWFSSKEEAEAAGYTPAGNCEEI